ncbi:MAG: hypothetical protein LBL70_02055, partial [Treponema sp.]|nr:hypothetical protein [Treponema sp.]
MDFDNFYFLNYQEKRGDIKLKLADPIKNKMFFLKGQDKNTIPLRLSFLKGRCSGDIIPLGTIGLWGYSP